MRLAALVGYGDIAGVAVGQCDGIFSLVLVRNGQHVVLQSNGVLACGIVAMQVVVLIDSVQ